MNNYIEAFGVIPSKKDIRAYKAHATVSNVDFPKSFELETVPVKNQGSTGSCVAHSLAEVIEYFNKKQEGTYIPMSIGFIYGNRRAQDWTGPGMEVAGALDAIRKLGDVPASKFNYNVEVPDAITLFENAMIDLIEDAILNRITSYFQLATDDDIKLNLMNNGPVIISTQWYKDMYFVDGVLTKPDDAEKNGYHCMIIYGWNEKGWLFQNSWGEHFGNKGRGILPYGTIFTDCYGVTDTYSEKKKEDLIKLLHENINNLSEKVQKSEEEINELKENLALYETALEEKTDIFNLTEKQKNEAMALIDEMRQKMLALESENEYREKVIHEQEAYIEKLNAKVFEIEKPYQNMPKWLALVINFIINLFRNRK